jgi:type II secretory pathway pseudopilin PulG
MNRKKAFTLIDILVYISIIGTVLFVLVEFLMMVQEARRNYYVKTEVSSQAQFIINDISSRVEKVDSVSTPSLHTTADNLVISLDGNNVSYYLQNGILYRDDGVNNIPLHNANLVVDSIEFRHLGDLENTSSIKVSLSLRYNGFSDIYYSRDFYKSITLIK